MGFSLGQTIGKVFNSVTGATSAAKQNQKYALQSAEVNNEYQKEFAQNAHQWEMQDLEKAGLNPVLSANSGASASGGGVDSASIAQSGINPIETAIGAWNGYEQARNTGADTNRKNAETANLEADTLLKGYQRLKIMAETAKTKAEREQIEKLMDAQLEEIKANTKLTKQQTKKAIGGKTAEYAGTGILDWFAGN